ncbi:hypothetical protein HZB02_06725 [Candidatus Woesearchaeota archaeon]|nr:hypothetical protein [Candidatus Woesearchaeota archaeon]
MILQGAELEEYCNYGRVYACALKEKSMHSEASQLETLMAAVQQLPLLELDTVTYLPIRRVQQSLLPAFANCRIIHHQPHELGLLGLRNYSSAWMSVALQGNLLSSDYKSWQMFEQPEQAYALLTSYGVQQLSVTTISFSFDSHPFPAYDLCINATVVHEGGSHQTANKFSLKDHDPSEGVTTISYNASLLEVYTSLIGRICRDQDTLYNDPASTLLQYRMFSGTLFGKGIMDDVVEKARSLISPRSCLE